MNRTEQEVYANIDKHKPCEDKVLERIHTLKPNAMYGKVPGHAPLCDFTSRQDPDTFDHKCQDGYGKMYGSGPSISFTFGDAAFMRTGSTYWTFSILNHRTGEMEDKLFIAPVRNLKHYVDLFKEDKQNNKDFIFPTFVCIPLHELKREPWFMETKLSSTETLDELLESARQKLNSPS